MQQTSGLKFETPGVSNKPVHKAQVTKDMLGQGEMEEGLGASSSVLFSPTCHWELGTERLGPKDKAVAGGQMANPCFSL